MSWKLLRLAISLLPLQAVPPQAGAPHSNDEIAVEVGPFPMDGLWYQDGVVHEHDGVRMWPIYHPEGAVEVTIGTMDPSGTDITFYFSHDRAGLTRASATAVHRSIVHTTSHTTIEPDKYPTPLHLSDLEGRILIQSKDWGPGKTLNALFAIRGMEKESPEFLVGSFSLLLRK